MSPFGRLTQLKLRDHWEDEAGDFTPWLAEEENIALVGDSIGMDLEVEAQEQSVGPFRADILCRDTNTDKLVLIENQLEPRLSKPFLFAKHWCIRDALTRP